MDLVIQLPRKFLGTHGIVWCWKLSCMSCQGKISHMGMKLTIQISHQGLYDIAKEEIKLPNRTYNAREVFQPKFDLYGLFDS
jgi:hypothetical protein